MFVAAQDVAGRKRNLWNFKSMIECHTTYSASNFRDYGCHCGWGGTKGVPALDDLDQYV